MTTTQHHTTQHHTTHMTNPDGAGRHEGAILHLDDAHIDTSIELFEAAGMSPLVLCDGSCGGVAGCTVAPLGGALAA